MTNHDDEGDDGDDDGDHVGGLRRGRGPGRTRL